MAPAERRKAVSHRCGSRDPLLLFSRKLQGRPPTSTAPAADLDLAPHIIPTAVTMSSDKEIGAPFTLASLSKPVGSTNGRIHATGVCSFSGIKKRKRTEIVVGVEGECISIYSVRRPKSLVHTHELPSDFPLAAKPPTRHIVCAPAQRILHSRPILDLPQGLLQDARPALHLRLRHRVHRRRQVAARLLPRDHSGRQRRNCKDLVHALQRLASLDHRVAARRRRQRNSRCARHL